MAKKAKARTRAPPDASLEIKPANKIRRQLQHIKRKRAKDAAKRAERFARKKEEAKDPRLKAERLRRNVPLTLERKRVWDEVDSDIEDGLGLSVDVERIKRQKQEEEEELNKPLPQDDSDNEEEQSDEDRDEEEGEESQAEDGEDQDQEDRDDLESLIASSDDEDEDDKKKEKKDKDKKKPSLPAPTERATSPTHSTKSTNLNLVPEALAAKFPTLFSTDASRTPKILITTSINSTLHHEARLLTSLFPNSVYIRRTAHRYAHKFSVREIAGFAANREYTALLVLEEDQKRPSGLTVVHLPKGPTFHFSISNWIEGRKLPGHGNPTSHKPELILNNFRTPLGLLTAHLFRSLFPPQPDLEGRQVVTLHNQRDYIFVRRHRYVFRERRESEKSVVGPDGKEIKGVEDIRAGLQELGPRFTLKLRRIDKGIQRASGQEWEWKGGMEKKRTRFQL